MTDPIADMLSRIRNATLAKQARVDMPSSRLKVEIARILEGEGYRVIAASDGEQAIEQWRTERPDFVCLDIMMPKVNGYDVCRQIRRADRSIPILFLSAKSEEIDKVLGLELGADDYVMKPFGMKEFVARIRAIFRRTTRAQITEAPIRIGTASIDPAAQTMKRGRETTSLSFYEVQLLKYLFERAGQVVSREELLDKVWGVEGSPTNRTIDNFIVKLRKKIEPNPEKPAHILTVYGLGYKLVV